MSNERTKTNEEEIAALLGGMLRELRCTICLYTLREAAVTPCSHYYCKECIEKAAENEDFKCPLCNREITLDHLIPAYSVREIVQEFLIMRQEFEQQHDMNLSQAPIRFLSHDDVIDLEIPCIPPPSNDEFPVSNMKNSTENRQLKIYIASTSVLDLNMPNVTIVDKISEDTTHIVMDFADGEHKLVKCNDIYLLGILFGCCIVELKWLHLCKESNKILPEERFEAMGDTNHGRTGAPKKSRSNRNEGKHQKLFKGLRAKFITDNKITRRYQKYVRIGGGVIVDHGEIIVCDEDMDGLDVDEIQAKYEGKKLLSKDWIDECICKYDLEKKDKHYL